MLCVPRPSGKHSVPGRATTRSSTARRATFATSALGGSVSQRKKPPSVRVHVTPSGQVVLCCQDYHEQYAVGDLHQESLEDILRGPRLALLRRWVYGMEEAPADFICRRCIYALIDPNASS